MSKILLAVATATFVLLSFGASAQRGEYDLDDYTVDFTFHDLGDGTQASIMHLDLKPGLRYTLASGEIQLSDGTWLFVNGTCLFGRQEGYLGCELNVPLDRATLVFEMIVDNSESFAQYTTSGGNRFNGSITID